MNTAKLIWATPSADNLLGYVARVSNPSNQNNPDVGKLLRYCAKNAHWSVFEHAHACIEITTTRDIGRQIIRHRSFAFSEFSQRYADVTEIGDDVVFRECRMQDTKNRQNSLVIDENNDDDYLTARHWEQWQQDLWNEAIKKYKASLALGIAKEQARALLPEGLTTSRLYMTGSLRSWITYCQVRLDPSTQKEHRLVAQSALSVLREVAPITMDAFFPTEKE